MKLSQSISILLSSYYLGVSALDVGDKVCITGYIMDHFCINFGVLLDDQSTVSLENPSVHSFHCLFDVDACRESGFQVLGPKNPDTGLHCLGYRFDDNDAVIEAGRSAGRAGYCSSCKGNSTKLEAGYRVTVMGTIKELGDGSDDIEGTPIIENVELLDEEVECEVETLPPLCSLDVKSSACTAASVLWLVGIALVMTMYGIE